MPLKEMGKQTLQQLNPISLLVIVMVALAMYLVGKMQGPDQETKTYQKEVKTWKATADSLSREVTKSIKQVEKVQKENAILEEKAEALQRQADKLDASNKSKKRKLDSMLVELKLASLPDSCIPAVKLAQQFKNLADSAILAGELKDKIIINKDLQIDGLNISVNSLKKDVKILQDTLAKIPTKPKGGKWLGFIPMVSRTASFLAGAATSAAVGVGLAVITK